MAAYSVFRNTIALLVLALAASASAADGNLLAQPGFEDWTKAWTRGGTHPGSTQWDSRWVKRTDSRSGECFMMAVKHNDLEPRDDATPVDVLFYQDVDMSASSHVSGTSSRNTGERDYEASLYIKTGGTGGRWDGPVGADQWTQIVVYLWKDIARTRFAGRIASPKIEVPVSRWHRFSVRFDLPGDVKAATYYCWARLVDRTPAAWVAWDDAYLGPATSEVEPMPENLLKSGDFDLDALAPTFATEGNAASLSLDTATKRQGGASLRVSNATLDSAYAVREIPFACADGARRARISVDCKTRNVVPGKMPWYSAREIVWFLDSEGKPFPKDGACVFDIVPFPTGTHDWTHCERTVIAPRGTVKLKVMLGLDNCSGEAWFDDARVEEVFDDYLIEEDEAVTAKLESKASSTMTEGIGWNWETVSFGRHEARELAIWPDLFERMAWDGPEMLRVAVLPAMFPPREYAKGKDTGERFTYDFNTRYVQNICRLLERCDKLGIHVLIANWHTGTAEYPDVPEGRWLQKGYYDGTDYTNADYLLPYSYERMAESLAEFIHYLRVKRGFECVKYVSVWNEPGYWVEHDRYPDGMVEVYRLLDARLREKGVRDKVKLLGMEMVEGGEGIRSTAQALANAPFIDVAAVHNYGYGLDFATATTASWSTADQVRDTLPPLRSIENLRKGGMPVMMTETNGFGTSPIYSERDRYLACLAAAQYAIDLIGVGFDALLKWQYNQPGVIQFCPFTIENGRAKPNRETYFPWAMLHRWTVRGSRVFRVTVTGGKGADGLDRVHAVALKAPGGQLTILVTNTGRIAKHLTLDLLAGTKGRLRHFYYDGSLPDGVREAAPVKVTGSQLTALLQPESVNVFTTFTTGLTGPAPR